jgi:hypothetical protein
MKYIFTIGPFDKILDSALISIHHVTYVKLAMILVRRRPG